MTEQESNEDRSDLPHPSMTPDGGSEEREELEDEEDDPGSTIRPPGGGPVPSTQPAEAERGTSGEKRSGEESTQTAVDGRYTYQTAIGSGGFGTVYRGRDRKLDRPVAVKEVDKIFEVYAGLDPDEIADRLESVARAQSRITHPGVGRVHDVDTSEPESPKVVGEYAPSGHLRRLIGDETDDSIGLAIEYFVQILHGIHAAHEQGLVHGNIKPENVVLGAHGNAKLVDFGWTELVNFDEELGPSLYVGMGVHAIEYRAPERRKRSDVATEQSDLYALGILLYELLTGRVPSLRSPMPSEVVPALPSALDEIFEGLAQADPGRRYRSVEAVLADLYGAAEIVDSIDRRTGVVYLADPMDGGRRPELGGAGGSARTSAKKPTGETNAPVNEGAVGSPSGDGSATSGPEDADDEEIEQSGWSLF